MNNVIIRIIEKVCYQVKDLYWIEPCYEIYRRNFVGMYDTYDDFVWNFAQQAVLSIPDYENPDKLPLMTTIAGHKIALISISCLTNEALQNNG